MASSHLFPYPLPKLSLDVIIFTITTVIIIFLLSEGVGSIWGKIKDVETNIEGENKYLEKDKVQEQVLQTLKIVHTT